LSNSYLHQKIKLHGLPSSENLKMGSNLNFSPPIDKSRIAAGFPKVRFGNVESPFVVIVAAPVKNLAIMVSEF
jgi:hypothetical protein